MGYFCDDEELRGWGVRERLSGERGQLGEETYVYEEHELSWDGEEVGVEGVEAQFAENKTEIGSRRVRWDVSTKSNLDMSISWRTA